MRFYRSASYVDTSFSDSTQLGVVPPSNVTNGITNLKGAKSNTSTSGSAIFTDIGSADQRYFSQGGQYGYIVDAAATSKAVGLIYYDSGIVVLDIEKVTSGSQFLSGTISAMTSTGQIMFGKNVTSTSRNSARLVPDLLISGSVDDIIDHFCYTRFGSAGLTAMTFQNVTNINSSLIFCRARPEDFNYSSNPTYVEPVTSNEPGKLTIYDPSQDPQNQEPFAYVTTIGLHDAEGTLVAVAKLSRPVEKNPSRDLTFRVRLDF
jgi:hypothetical protein